MKKLSLLLVFISVLLTLCVSVSASSGGMLSPAMKILSENELMIKSGLVSGDIIFTEEDFAHAVGCSVDYITITAIPPAAEGTLYFADAPVSVNQVISGNSLSKLKFIPKSGCTESSFRFKSGGDYSIMCKVCYTDSINFAPVTGQTGDAVAVWTQSDIAAYGTLSASDPEGDELVFEITKYPEKGIISLTNSSSGDYIYTPCDGLTGKDSFSYIVRDCFGNYSEEAAVEIEIDKRTAELVFADMEGHWAHNAALVMAAENSMDVRSVGGELYFDPDEEITREDFVVTVMKALGSGEIPTCPTNFADDDAISTDAKGYIARAAELGIIKGSQEDGVSYFKPQDSITRAEAAVVLNSIIGAAEPDAVPVFADVSAVPAWAKGALYALTDAGIFKGTGNGYISPNSVLSRGETAQILLTVKQIYDK